MLRISHGIAFITFATLKLVADRQTDQPTNRQTDIVTYRAAIAAKKHKIKTQDKPKKLS